MQLKVIIAKDPSKGRSERGGCRCEQRPDPEWPEIRSYDPTTGRSEQIL